MAYTYAEIVNLHEQGNGELWLVNEDELVKPSEFSEEFAMFVNDFLAEEK